ncbi:hypothetical protein [Nonomuraea recticatena]|uniref:hypothetical protein n=1 Tax=Nonomuraea recticatena TaxID=46178 RepID=UPI00360652FF
MERDERRRGALGVLIGGLLTEYAGWRWVMFVNVPMAACALALVWRGVTAGPPRLAAAALMSSVPSWPRRA